MTDVAAVAGAALYTPHGPLPLTATFQYSRTDPMAVSMVLTVDIDLGNGAVASDEYTWVFARDLIDSALSQELLPAGDGDVTVEYCAASDALTITLTHLDGVKYPLIVDAEPVADFMARSLACVPANAEVVDVDGAIAQILGESSC